MPNQNDPLYYQTNHWNHQLISGQDMSWFPAFIPPATATTNVSIYHGAGKWDGQGIASVGVNGRTFTARPVASNDGVKTVANLTLEPVADSYVRSMWNPTFQGLEPGHSSMKEQPPKWFGLGLAPIMGVTAANNNITYQEGQIYWSLHCEATVSFEPNHFTTHGANMKPYTELIWGYGDAAFLSNQERMSAWNLYGRPAL